jgi:hypothetical protein
MATAVTYTVVDRDFTMISVLVESDGGSGASCWAPVAQAAGMAADPARPR